MCTCEVHWPGFDVDRARRVFGMGPGAVTAERNVYLGVSAQFEGEETCLSTLTDGQPYIPNTPTFFFWNSSLWS